jgi:hypothetical protein
MGESEISKGEEGKRIKAYFNKMEKNLHNQI